MNSIKNDDLSEDTSTAIPSSSTTVASSNTYLKNAQTEQDGQTREQVKDVELNDEKESLHPEIGKRNKWIRKLKVGSAITTSRFWVCLILGQLIALCLCGTNTFTSFLTQNDVNTPALQSLLPYALLIAIFVPISLFCLGFKRFISLSASAAPKFCLLSLFDAGGNYFVVMAYRYSNLLSCQLLNCWATVVVVILSYIFLKVRYKKTQLLGVMLCLVGFALLTVSDVLTGKNWSAKNPVKGNLFMILGATLYGASNILEEIFSLKLPLYLFASLIGIGGSIISGVLCAIFERRNIPQVYLSSSIAGYYAGFATLLALVYVLLPILMRIASATFYNLSILTAVFWGLLIGIRVFGFEVYWLYPIAFLLIIAGQVLYFLFLSSSGEGERPWMENAREDKQQRAETGNNKQGIDLKAVP